MPSLSARRPRQKLRPPPFVRPLRPFLGPVPSPGPTLTGPLDRTEARPPSVNELHPGARLKHTRRPPTRAGRAREIAFDAGFSAFAAPLKFREQRRGRRRFSGVAKSARPAGASHRHSIGSTPTKRLSLCKPQARQCGTRVGNTRTGGGHPSCPPAAPGSALPSPGAGQRDATRRGQHPAPVGRAASGESGGVGMTGPEWAATEPRGPSGLRWWPRQGRAACRRERAVNPAQPR